MRLRGRKLTELRERVRREQPLCAHCKAEGKVSRWTELDHIIPLEHGGTNHRDNLQGLCTPHHKAKTAADRGYQSAGACDAQGNPLDPEHAWNKG